MVGARSGLGINGGESMGSGNQWGQTRLKFCKARDRQGVHGSHGSDPMYGMEPSVPNQISLAGRSLS